MAFNNNVFEAAVNAAQRVPTAANLDIEEETSYDRLLRTLKKTSKPTTSKVCIMW